MKQLLEKINRASCIALLPHIHADGDAYGSSYALAKILGELGKTASVILEEQPLSRFDYLQGNFQVYGESGLPSYDLVIAVDCSDVGRLGRREKLFCGATACIDHHLTKQPMGELSYVDPTAAATAELIYQFSKEAGVMNKSIAACLYTALSTDSGSFRYSNTTPKTLRIAAELMEQGIDCAMINRKLYEQVSLGSLRFQAECVEKMQLFFDGRVAITSLSMERAQQLGLTSEDTDGGGSIMLSLCGVCVGAFFHEREKGVFKVSLRSDEKVDVATVAASFGGGGHLRASGYSTTLPLSEGVAQLQKKLREQLGAL